MPNFITHWLVAIESLSSITGYLDNGYRVYAKLTNQLRKKLEKSKKSNYYIKSTISEYIKDILSSSAYDDMTCFSAYALGACGPDFWTLPSESTACFGMDPIPDTAGIHFDLGHYNRTHAQFIRFLEDVLVWDAAKLDELQRRVRLAYFLGMATHVATDLVMHQLVNVYAGAYNLLDKAWENEHGRFWVNLWSTHNKVEHYWDAYLRYRYIGDYGPVFFDERGVGVDREDWFEPLGFPIKEKLLPEAIDGEAVYAPHSPVPLYEKIKPSDPHPGIEIGTNLPRIFCDRVISGEIEPFVYKYVVDKSAGAYRSGKVFKQAADESRHGQFLTDGKYDERRKLAFFSSARNTRFASCSHNYLTYVVCPRLERLQRYGRDVFYHLDALKGFLQAAVCVSKAFVKKLVEAYEQACGHAWPMEYEPDLGVLGKFWNLDTGTGIEVVNERSDTGYEVITKIDMVHIFDQLGHCMPWYKKKTPYLKGKRALMYENPDVRPAFRVYQPEKPFKDLNSLAEPGGDKYLERIRLEEPENLPESEYGIDEFFSRKMETGRPVVICKTQSWLYENVIVARSMKARLSLRFTTGLLDLEDGEELGFYLLGDDRGGLRDSVKYEKDRHLCKEWLSNSKELQGVESRVLEFAVSQGMEPLVVDGVVKSERSPVGLCRFGGNWLVNFGRDTSAEREIEPGGWNNVIEYVKHRRDYGRNYAVATGRKNVLKPLDTGDFHPDETYGVYADVSPTEHVFLSLYLLVRDRDGCYDLISKEPVDEKQLEELAKIDCLGFVKIVLFYVQGGHGVLQLGECLIDGLRVPVQT